MFYFFISGMIVVFDYITKKAVIKNIPQGARFEIVKNSIYLCHIKNQGVAYNKFARYPRAILCVISSAIGVIAYCLYQTTKEPGRMIFKTAGSFLLGGAVGNFIDRLKHNGVTDFIYIKKKRTPIFNIADVFILAGGTLCFLSSLFTSEK